MHSNCFTAQVSPNMAERKVCAMKGYSNQLWRVHKTCVLMKV